MNASNMVTGNGRWMEEVVQVSNSWPYLPCFYIEKPDLEDNLPADLTEPSQSPAPKTARSQAAGIGHPPCPLQSHLALPLHLLLQEWSLGEEWDNRMLNSVRKLLYQKS